MPATKIPDIFETMRGEYNQTWSTCLVCSCTINTILVYFSTKQAINCSLLATKEIPEVL